MQKGEAVTEYQEEPGVPTRPCFLREGSPRETGNKVILFLRTSGFAFLNTTNLIVPDKKQLRGERFYFGSQAITTGKQLYQFHYTLKQKQKNGNYMQDSA